MATAAEAAPVDDGAGEEAAAAAVPLPDAELGPDVLQLRDVGSEAVWSLSTCKQGFGVHQLLDARSTTYWQSDGVQPHMIDIQFLRRMTLDSVALYTDFAQDESYTPSLVSVRVGSHPHPLEEITKVEIGPGTGWTRIKLQNADGRPLQTFTVRVAILANHQNGRDSHLRNVRIFAPKPT